jgi:molecular chaperone DnaK
MSDDVAIGIDLGTSNSCVAVARGRDVEVLPNAYGEHVTASVVAFREDGAITVGNAAKANIIHEPKHTVYSAKRLIGRYFFSEELKKAQAVCSYRIVEGPNHGIRIQARGEQFSLPEISAMVLREMKSIAEDRLGHPVRQAVITVPAYFNDNQRQATKDAGRIAGLEVLRLLNEPTAAALAYGFGRGLDQRVAIYDLGGGTFDISILEIGQDVFEVLSTCGDTYLGGDDLDDRLIDLLADEFMARENINLRQDPYALEKLKVAAETAKKGLSVEDQVEINIPEVIEGADGQSLSLTRTVARAEFTSLIMDLVQRTFKVCDEALQQANMVARDLDGVILVGGPTRLPMVREAVGEYFQQEPKDDVDPDEVVAMGAAIHAASLISPSQESYLLDVTPLSLRIGVAGGLAEPVIERNTPVPIEQTRSFTTVQDFQERVKIRVYQGESRRAEENEMLGQFEFSGFKNAPRGQVQIDVTFEINGDGIVSVTACDQETGQQASTEISLSSGLSEDEIEDIIDGGRTDRVDTPTAEAIAHPPVVPPSEPPPMPTAAPAEGAAAQPEALESAAEPEADELDLLPDEDDLELEVDPPTDLEPPAAFEPEPEPVAAELPPAAPIAPEAAARPIGPPNPIAVPVGTPVVAGESELELDPGDLEGLEDLDLGAQPDLDPGAPPAIGGAAEFSEGDFVTSPPEEEDENAKTQPDLEPEISTTVEPGESRKPAGSPSGDEVDLFGDVGADLSQLGED